MYGKYKRKFIKKTRRAFRKVRKTFGSSYRRKYRSRGLSVFKKKLGQVAEKKYCCGAIPNMIIRTIDADPNPSSFTPMIINCWPGGIDDNVEAGQHDKIGKRIFVRYITLYIDSIWTQTNPPVNSQYRFIAVRSKHVLTTLALYLDPQLGTSVQAAGNMPPLQSEPPIIKDVKWHIPQTQELTKGHIFSLHKKYKFRVMKDYCITQYIGEGENRKVIFNNAEYYFCVTEPYLQVGEQTPMTLQVAIKMSYTDV